MNDNLEKKLKKNVKHVTLCTAVYGLTTIALACCSAVSYLLFISGFWMTHGKEMLQLALLTIFLSTFIASQHSDDVRRNLLLDSLRFLIVTIMYGVVLGVTLPIISYELGSGLIFTSLIVATLTFLFAAIYGHKANIDTFTLSHIMTMASTGFIICSFLYMLIAYFIMPIGFIDLVLAYVGLCVFVGFTVLCSGVMSELESHYNTIQNNEERAHIVVLLAMSMFINFIGIFINILEILMNKKRR